MDTILFKIKRQDDLDGLPYWEKFELPFHPGMTVASALRSIGENPSTSEDNRTSPVVFEASCLEGVCGSCTMLINGQVRQACRMNVEDLDQPIVLEPMTKFPLVRDLEVDRSRMFDVLDSFACRVDIDGLHHVEEAPVRISRSRMRDMERFLGCIMCGACVEACPQVNERSPFVGAFIFGHALALNMHPAGADGTGEMLGALAERGGIADCAGAGNCTEVCPSGVTLTEAAGRLGPVAARSSLRKFLWG